MLSARTLTAHNARIWLGLRVFLCMRVSVLPEQVRTSEKLREEEEEEDLPKADLKVCPLALADSHDSLPACPAPPGLV